MTYKFYSSGPEKNRSTAAAPWFCLTTGVAWAGLAVAEALAVRWWLEEM